MNVMIGNITKIQHEERLIMIVISLNSVCHTNDLFTNIRYCVHTYYNPISTTYSHH